MLILRLRMLWTTIPTPTFSMAQFKVALFEFLLGVLNGDALVDIFDKKKIEAKTNRANRERKRLARKRRRAAKREREREARKAKKPGRIGKTVSDGQTRTCQACGKHFASRKRASRHKCARSFDVKTKGVLAPVVPSFGESKRARRARNRKAKATRCKAQAVALEDVAGRLATFLPGYSMNKLLAGTSVTVSLGSRKRTRME
jgi:hypothetical protein